MLGYDVWVGDGVSISDILDPVQILYHKTA